MFIVNILYINHYAGSPKYGMEYRPYYLSSEWIKLGHNVKIIASSFSHLRKIQPESKYLQPFLEKIDDIPYLWIKGIKYKTNGSGRLFNILSFLSGVFFRAKKISHEFKPNVVIASSTYPLDIYVAYYLAKCNNAKLVFEVHDLWPLSPIELSNISPNNPFMRWCQAAEDFAYKNSDIVVSILPNVHDHMQTHGLDLNKLHIVSNGVVADDWKTDNILPIPDSLQNIIDSLKKENKCIIGYAGSLGMPNAMEYLLQAASLIKNSNFHFLIVGDGLEKNNLIKLSKKLNLDNVTFHNQITKKAIPALLSYFDIAYIGWRKKSIYRFGIAPNKLFDYMMAECLILHSVSAGNDLVQDAFCGVSVEPENPAAIVQGILKLSHLDKSIVVKMKTSGRDFVIKNHTYTVLANKFLKVISNE